MEETLAEALPKEQARCREILGYYKELPTASGIFGATMIETALKNADTAIMSGDVVEMIKAYKELKGIK